MLEDTPCRTMYDTVNRDMWWVLMLRTTGEPHGKVRSSGPGMGLEGYRTLSAWYMTMSGSTVHQLRSAAMKPKQATSEDAVAAVVDSWREQLAHLWAMGTNNDRYRNMSRWKL